MQTENQDLPPVITHHIHGVEKTSLLIFLFGYLQVFGMFYEEQSGA